MFDVTPAANRIWFRVIRLHQRLHGALSARLRELELSVPQFDVLSTLTEREGITQRELAERLYVTKGNVSGLVDRLVEAGLVERKTVAGDRRSHALFLTAEGRRLAAQGQQAQADLIARTLGRLPADDIEMLDRLVAGWRDTLRELESNQRRNAPERSTVED